MKIKKIDIVNFKGFQHETIEFKGNLTVVIGNNTAGKTTLLKALQVGLGAYLQCLNQLPGGAPYRRNFSAVDRFKRFNPELRDYIANEEKPRITIEGEFPVVLPSSNKEVNLSSLSFKNPANKESKSFFFIALPFVSLLIRAIMHS